MRRFPFAKSAVGLAVILAAQAAQCAMRPARTQDPYSAFSREDRDELSRLRAWHAAKNAECRMQALVDSAQHPVVRDINDDPTLLRVINEEEATRGR